MSRPAAPRSAVLAVLLLVFSMGAARGAEAPALFAFADDAAAQAAWQPMGGTAPASVAEVDGRKALRMPCNFRGTKIERASWDRQVRLDLTACRGVEFKIFARDASPVSHFSLYLQSGEGWYSAAFSPAEKGKWSTVTIDKDQTRIEGRPAGWAAISTIRISAWRGQDRDTEFCLADFALLGAPGGIAVVRGESAARSAPGEVESVCQFTETVARCLKDLGVPHAVISDLDATPERLKACSLVILPHNPSMPDDAAGAIAKFVEGGGKLIAFYALHGRLRDLLGVRGAEHVPQKYRGQFASIHFKNDTVLGLPAEVGQQSWNIQGVWPVEGKSRVAARWFDADGKDTGYPAVILSDNGIYMTHVLLSDDAASKRRMLLAMVGHFVPEAWKQAAGASIARIGRFGPYQGFDEAYSGIAPLAKGNGNASNALVWAKAYRGEALAPKSFDEGISAAENAQSQMVKAWCAVQKSVPGEHRALWCHSAFGPQGMTWDEAIKILAENGFTAVLPNMLWGGAAYYESSVLPVAPEVNEKGDQVAACLAACKKYGVQIHVWKVNYNMGGRSPREFRDRMKRDGRTQVGFDSKPQDSWLCPSHPDNQKLEIDSMVEVAAKYEVDGIHFDYIRYPDADHCFCPGCRERFEKVSGAKIAAWPADVRKDEALRGKWLQWRRDQITQVVAAVSEVVRRSRPKCKISAAVFSNWAADRDKVGQDWKLWCDRGYLDFVCPMDYTPHNAAFEGLVAAQVPLAGKVPCYPGIGLSTWSPPTDACKVIEQILIARRAGAKGFTIFEFNPATAREVLPLLGQGITRKE
ncbi:MAG: family 10 glycosylhydrolase [Planctomycetes bacterium]|nr:family 10 glycosylhydrolase [Planctomycetota bacterium]